MKNKLRWLILCFAWIALSLPANAQPCNLCGTTASEWIAGITINGSSGLFDIPGGNAGGCVNLSVLDAYIAILKKGVSHSFSLSPGFAGAPQSEYWKIWIDLNQDGDFDDPGDLVFASGVGATTTLNGSFFIPVSAITGPTAMRVAMRRGSLPPDCGNFSNGQVLTYNKIYLDECDISFTNACAFEYIKQVNIQSINNSSGCGTTGYQDFTNLFTTLDAGSTNPVQLTPGFIGAFQRPERWLIWIDFNKDLDFDDPGEKVFDSGAIGSSGATLGNIIIPLSAQTATTRMRIKMIPTGSITATLDPCNPVPGTFIFEPPEEYGEAEDYTVNIQHATLEVQGGFSAETLVKDVLVGGDCFDISNVTYSGEDGQIGKFSKGLSNIGFSTGLILATGDISAAPGPNNQDNASAGYGISTPDDDLNVLSGGAIFDMAAIEFDITPTQSTLTLDYVFASEEYCEYVNSQFQDAFGIFISGPGINGPFAGAANMALIPSTNIDVGVNTVNHLSNSGLYINNQPADSNDLCGQPPATQPAVNEIQYDGFTRKMTAVATVIPCETYHIKLKIADTGDGIYDSALFLKAGSFDAGGNASVDFVVNGDPDAGEVYEGCGTVQLIFNRVGGNPNIPMVVQYTVTGTATPGVDYSPIPTIVVIPAGQNSVALNLNILNDLLPEGLESVVITLNNPCSCTTPQKVLLIKDLPVLQAIPDTVAICSGGLAVVGVNVTSGVDPYTYNWQNGSTSAQISVFANVSTNYNVTVTDACGKTLVATARLIVSPAPTGQLLGPGPQLCPGQTATVMINFNGTGPFSINYNFNGIAQPTITGIMNNPYALVISQPGMYQLIGVSDGLGCSGPGGGTVIVVASTLDLTGVVSNANCNGQANGTINTTVTGGQGPYSYGWTGGISNIADPIGLQAGNYTVTVTDGSGCTDVQAFTVNAPSALLPAVLSVQNPTCASPTSGSIDLNVTGGTPGYTYFWSNGTTLQDPQGLAPGLYTVTVTDAHGCTGTAVATVTGSPAPTPSISATPLCAGGTSTLSVAGGTFNFVAWSTGQAGSSISVTAPGTYTVTVTDANACTGTASKVVSIIPGPSPVISGPAGICNGGTATLSVGTFPAISWSTGQNNNSISVSGPGIYTVTVTGANGCTGTGTYNLPAFPSPTPVIQGPTSLCSGIALLSVPGSYTSWSWSNGTTGSAMIVVNNIGTYTVTVTAANGCTGTTSHNISMLNPVAEISGDATLCPGGTAELMASGSPGTIVWKNGNGQILGNGAVLTVNQAGTYILQITSMSGSTSCTAADTVLVKLSPVPTITATGAIIGCAYPVVSIVAGPLVSGSNFEWSGPANFSSTNPTPQVNAPGIYFVTVTNTEGCTASASAVVSLEDKTNTFEILPAMPVIGLVPAFLTDVAISAAIQNHEGNSITIQWTKTMIDLSPNCEPRVEDKSAYYPSAVATGQFSLNANELAPLNVHLTDSNTDMCCGMVYIQCRNLCTLRDTLTVVYLAECIDGTSVVAAKNITVLPNPSSGNFKLRNVPPGVEALEVIGVDGKLVYTQKIEPGDHDFSLSGHKAGTYFAILRDGRGNLVRVFVLVLVE